MDNLISSWIKATELSDGNPGASADNWAIQHVLDLHLDHKYEDILKIILAIVSATDSQWVLKCVGAGPLEDLLTKSAAEYIERIEHEAMISPKFKVALSAVWLDEEDTLCIRGSMKAAELNLPLTIKNQTADLQSTRLACGRPVTLNIGHPALRLNHRHVLFILAACFLLGCTPHEEPSTPNPITLAVKLQRAYCPTSPGHSKNRSPPPLEEFVAALRAYGKLMNAPVSESELDTRYPLASLDVTYTYAQRTESGEWIDVPVTLRIRRAEPPTYAQLLYEIHSASAEKLHDRDHHFFEGLWLTEYENERGVPVYELYLGS